MVFASNIKLLRKRHKRTQDEVAGALDMKRSTVSGYENEVAQPGIDVLIAFSKYYNIAIDTLIKEDLSQLTENQLLQVERGLDIFINGGELRIHTTSVDANNNENIELVNYKASAGYRAGYADSEYIRVLPTFHMPFLSREKKYRTFQIVGDSMLPIPTGSWVTGEFIQNWHLLRDGQAYIILTIEDGIVFKVVENHIKENGKLRLYSLNSFYKPYEIDIKEVREIWKFVHYISSEMPETNQPRQNLERVVADIKRDVEHLKQSMGESVIKLSFEES
jgi:transcriptional regulator with XRE-family HTH domain